MIFSEYYLCLLSGMKCNQRTGRNFRLILILNFKISCRQHSLKFNFVCMYYIKCDGYYLLAEPFDRVMQLN